jgi:type IV pilus assembly protein PilB
MEGSFNKNFLIGVELVRRRYITQDQLDEGLILQQLKKIRLGEALIELGYLTEDDLAKVLAAQLNIPYVDFNAGEIPANVLSRMPLELIKSNSIIPIAFTDDSLTVCLVDPLDARLQGFLEKYMGIQIKVAIAGKTAIRKAIDRYYTYE